MVVRVSPFTRLILLFVSAILLYALFPSFVASYFLTRVSHLDILFSSLNAHLFRHFAFGWRQGTMRAAWQRSLAGFPQPQRASMVVRQRRALCMYVNMFAGFKRFSQH